MCKTLAPLDGNRKCFRLVGDVLVERTVAEVIPAVTSNKQQLEMVSILARDRVIISNMFFENYVDCRWSPN